jgi:putative acetyltransferase
VSVAPESSRRKSSWPVDIRRQRFDERAAVREVVAAAFDSTVVADLAEALQDARAGRDGLSFVAAVPASSSAGQGDQVVGHVQLSRSWLDAPDRLVDVLVLSPLSVAPGYQRSGIGGRLVRHAIQAAGDVGAPLLFLEGNPAYYARFEFERASARGFTAPSVRIPDPAFQVYVLPGYRPEMTGALVYAEEFWAYDCVGLREH